MAVGRAVVTGGAGFVGSSVVEALTGRGTSVLVVDDLSTSAASNLDRLTGTVELLKHDIRDAGPLRAAFTAFCERLLTGRPLIVFGDGTQTRDFVHVGDVAAANLAAADSPDLPHRVYNVGTGTEVSIRELLRATATAASADPDAVVAVPAPRRPGEVHRSCLDVRRSVAELGLARPVPLVEGLRRTLGWIRSR